MATPVGSDDNFKGFSQFTSAIGGFFVGGLLGRIVAYPIAVVSVIKQSVGGAAIAWSLGAIGAITGTVYGWNKASEAQNQHNKLISDRNELKHQIQVMEASQEAAKSALNGWADKLGKSSDGTFADKAAASKDTGKHEIA